METITVDSSLCVRCGLCVRDCPMGILALPPDGQVPRCVAPSCIACNHCVCVCPTGALRLKGLRDESVVAKSASPASREQVAALVRERRSVRQFRPEPLPHSVIRDLLATSCSAPTGGNMRPVSYVVVEKPELLSEMRDLCCEALRKVAAADPIIRPKLEAMLGAVKAGHDVVLRGVPQLLVAYAPSGEHTGGMADIDLAIALTTAELVAASMGLGTCWNGFIMLSYNTSPAMQEARLRLQCFGSLWSPRLTSAGSALCLLCALQLFERLGVPRGSRIEVLMIGTPAVQYTRAVVRDPPPIVFN
eukprot:m51a1_g403 hypothetical protein (304) ;mRNA; r:724878-725959